MPTLRLHARAIGLLAVALASLSACSEGRFPGCKENADCNSDAGKAHVCFNLRCVECHYDSDCPAGAVCGGANTCSHLQPKPSSNEKDK